MTQIRPARLDDAAPIADVYAHHVAHGTTSFDMAARSVADTEAKIAQALARGWPFLSVESDGVVVGYAYATPFRDRPAYAFACENSIYVRHDMHGRGIGSGLLSALIDAAQAAGFRQMIAVIGGGEPASVAMHARARFIHAGRMQSVGRKFGQWLDTVYMQRALGAGDTTPPDREPA